jgi:hypothetical protein
MILLEKYHMINIDNLDEAEEEKLWRPDRARKRNSVVPWMGVANLFSLAYQAE